jgi:cell division protein FtsX
MYLLKLSLRPWRRSPYSQLFTSLAVGVLLFLASFLFWMQRSLGPVIERLTNEQVITAYLDPNLSAKGEAEVVDTIRTNLGAHFTAQMSSQGSSQPQPDIELIESDRFINHLRGDYPDLARELEDLGSEMQSVIPHYISISGILPPNTFDEVKSVRGIQSADSSSDRFRNVVGAFRALKWIITLLTFGLGLALITGLIHLGRTNAYLYQESSLLMKLMGASQAALRIPGLVSGLLVGSCGGAFAATGWTTLGISMTHHVRSLSPMLRYMPEGHAGFALVLILAGAILGAASGTLGDILSSQTVGSSHSGRS